MTSIALNNLWIYIESLNLSARNRKWLADKLSEPSVKTRTNACTLPKLTEEEICIRIAKAEEDIKKGRTLNAEEAHKKIEERFPWLCD